MYTHVYSIVAAIIVARFSKDLNFTWRLQCKPSKLTIVCYVAFICLYIHSHHQIQHSVIFGQINSPNLMLANNIMYHQYGRYWYIGMARVPHMRNTNMHGKISEKSERLAVKGCYYYYSAVCLSNKPKNLTRNHR